MIKLIGIDLDGTLLYPKRHLTVLIRKNTNFLKIFIAKGGKVIFVSGRNPMMQKKVEKKVGAQIPILCCNGSFLSIYLSIILSFYLSLQVRHLLLLQQSFL